MFYVDKTKRPEKFLINITLLIVHGSTSYRSDTISAVNSLPFCILCDKACISAFLYIFGNFLNDPFPLFFFPFVAFGCAVKRFSEAFIVLVSQLEQ